MTATGCATIVNGTEEIVSLQSEPSGATVTVSGVGTTHTPATLPLTRGKEYTIMFKKNGYKTQALVLKSRFEHWGEAIFGNTWNYESGLFVDIIYGGAYEFDNTLINCILEENKNETLDKPVTNQ